MVSRDVADGRHLREPQVHGGLPSLLTTKVGAAARWSGPHLPRQSRGTSADTVLVWLSESSTIPGLGRCDGAPNHLWFVGLSKTAPRTSQGKTFTPEGQPRKIGDDEVARHDCEHCGRPLIGSSAHAARSAFPHPRHTTACSPLNAWGCRIGALPGRQCATGPCSADDGARRSPVGRRSNTTKPTRRSRPAPVRRRCTWFPVRIARTGGASPTASWQGSGHRWPPPDGPARSQIRGR